MQFGKTKKGASLCKMQPSSGWDEPKPRRATATTKGARY